MQLRQCFARKKNKKPDLTGIFDLKKSQETRTVRFVVFLQFFAYYLDFT